MLRQLLLLVAPQLVGLLPFLFLRRSSVAVPLVLGPALAAVFAGFAGAVDVHLPMDAVAPSERYPACGLQGLALGLLPFMLAGFHCIIAVISNGVAVLIWRRINGARQ